MTLHNYRLICPSATLFYHGHVYEQSIPHFFPWDAVFKGVYRNSVLQTAIMAGMSAFHKFIGTWRTKVDFYITLTNFSRKKFVSSTLGIPESKLLIKPNFVVDEGGEAAERKDFFLFLGRLSEEKGVDTLLRAARLCNLPITIAGDGPLRDDVLKEAETNKNINYVGYQNRESAMQLVKTCKALVVPSVNYEGFPINILEAFAASTPVIASRLGSMEEIIQDDVNGRHFNPGDEKDLAAKLTELELHPATGERLARNARQTYLREYTPEKNYSRLINIYQLAVASKRQLNKVALGATRLGNA
jgi:glycosyltransferase involved in cell wall biosynthesis